MARKKTPAEYRIDARKMLESAKNQKLSQALERAASQSIRSNNAVIVELSTE